MKPSGRRKCSEYRGECGRTRITECENRVRMLQNCKSNIVSMEVVLCNLEGDSDVCNRRAQSKQATCFRAPLPHVHQTITHWCYDELWAVSWAGRGFLCNALRDLSRMVVQVWIDGTFATVTFVLEFMWPMGLLTCRLLTLNASVLLLCRRDVALVVLPSS